jgi:ribonucleotide reductase alpha subunit
MIVNKHLVKDLKKLNLWNNDMREELIKNYGSVQNLNIPDNLKEIYKTVWEIKQKSLINHAIARGPFVDQSQSMNLYFKKPTSIALTSALFYGWKGGLKTGSYYLRSHPAANAQQLSIDASKKEEQECLLCSA